MQADEDGSKCFQIYLMCDLMVDVAKEGQSFLHEGQPGPVQVIFPSLLYR